MREASPLPLLSPLFGSLGVKGQWTLVFMGFGQEWEERVSMGGRSPLSGPPVSLLSTAHDVVCVQFEVTPAPIPTAGLRSYMNR